MVETWQLRALVVEDEWPSRNYLVETLQASGLAEVSAAVATLEEARQSLAPGGVEVDAAFVDINLATSPGKDAGLTLVRDLAGRPGAPLFVFTTALKQHTLEAFELGVADYLLKPFSEERVRQCLLRLQARLPRPSRQPSQARVVARHKKGLVFLRWDEVWAFEAAERLTFVHSSLGRFDIDLSLAAIEASFTTGLLRVHRNWLINTDHIKTIERQDGDTELFVGDDLAEPRRGVRVPVARERAPTVRELLLASATGIRRP